MAAYNNVNSEVFAAQGWPALFATESRHLKTPPPTSCQYFSCDLSDDEEDRHSTCAGSEGGRTSSGHSDTTAAASSPLAPTVSPAASPPEPTVVEPAVELFFPEVAEVVSPPPGIIAPPGLDPPVFSTPPGFARLPWHPTGAEEAGQPVAPVLPPSPTKVQLQVADSEARKVLATMEDIVEEMPVPFDKKAFHRDLSTILRDLASASSVSNAVQQIRSWRVPKSEQAAEFMDLLTRAAEEGRGLARRRCFTLVAGLAAGSPSAFARDECLAGVGMFFKEVYQGLSLEVPRLPAIAANELVPTLATVLPKKKLRAMLPRGLECALVQAAK